MLDTSRNRQLFIEIFVYLSVIKGFDCKVRETKRLGVLKVLIWSGQSLQRLREEEPSENKSSCLQNLVEHQTQQFIIYVI